MSVHKRKHVKESPKNVLIRIYNLFNPPKKEITNVRPFAEVTDDLKRLWLLPNDALYSIKGKLRSHERRNFETDWKKVPLVDRHALSLALKHLERISIEQCKAESKLGEMEGLSLCFPSSETIFSEIKRISTLRQLHNISITAKERAEVTFFNDILSISLNLIRLEPKLESEIMRFLFKLIPSPLYSHYLSQKGQLNVMKSLSPIERLQEVCRNYLEMSIQSPPVIQRSLAVDQSVVEKLEQLINETKQAKRMTFKTAEEIKQVVLEASGVEEEVTSSDDRDAFVRTVIELYDSMFHLVRMFKTNGNKELYEATSKELARMEVAIKEVDLEALKAVGEKIDPSYMQGVAVVPSIDADGFDQYVVYDEIRKGFKDLKEDRIIREAQVITVLN